jgi:hypothetical protein
MKHGRRGMKLGSPGRDDLLAQALASANMVAAWKRVKSNRGSAGVDGRSIAETADVPESALAPDSGGITEWQLPA